jgi:hypothetical protein
MEIHITLLVPRTLRWLPDFAKFVNVCIKITVFWDVSPCSLVEVYQLLGELVASIFRFHVEVGKSLPEYTIRQPTRQQSA